MANGKKKNLDSWYKRLSLKLERIKFSDKIFLIDNLRVMIKAGLSLVEGLRILEAQIPSEKIKRMIAEMREEVEKGRTLADTLARFPQLFPNIYVKMIAAGEVSGKLEDSLSEAVNQMKKTYAMNSKIRGAMIYPLVIMTAVIGIGIEMVVFVLPKLMQLFSEMNVALPLPTRILIATSNFLIHYGIFVLIAAVLLTVGYFRIKDKSQVRSFLDAALLKAPIFGHISRQINLARFSLTLGSLLKSAIPIIDAVNITAEVLNNYHYKRALLKVSQEIKTGRPLSQLLSEYPKFFPPLTTQMILVGEQSGTMESLLNELANYYNEEVDQLLKNISTIIEPVIIIILGLVVGGLAVSVIMPMYSLSQAI